MTDVLVVFHIIVCILLIIVVLLQFGKGAEVGAIMGSGASQALFTSSQQGNIFTKATTVLAILFMVNSISLSIVASKDVSESIMEGKAPLTTPLNSDTPAQEMPKTEAAPAQADSKK